MSKIEDEPFFNDRAVKAVQACLSSRENLNIITPIELKIMRQAPVVRRLNERLDGGLIQRLHGWTKSISVNDALEILFDATREELIPMVTDLLDSAVSLEMHISLEDAYSTLERAQEEGIPASWMLQIMGDEIGAPAEPDTDEGRGFRIRGM